MLVPPPVPLDPLFAETDGRMDGQAAAAAILSVRCQYFPNVTGFLGVDRAISCFAGCRGVSSASASARRAVVDAVRHMCYGNHGCVQAESGKRAVNVTDVAVADVVARGYARDSPVCLVIAKRKQKRVQRSDAARIELSSRRRRSPPIVAGNVVYATMIPAFDRSVRFRSRVPNA